MARSRSLLSSFLAASFALAIAAGSFVSCTTTEGDRCNVSLSHDECASGLACSVPANCTYGVCCPKDGRPSSSSACNACPGEDAGEDDASTPAADAEASTPNVGDDAGPDAANDADTQDAADAAEGG